MATGKTVWPEEWDTTDALTQLIAQFNASANYYNPKSAADIETQARDEAAALYNAQRLAATQAQERSDLALAQQYAGLQATYDKSREASQKQYNQAYSQADRGMISRGMQRSSYGSQTLANISKQGAEAQQALWDEQAAAEGNINAQRAQLSQQLATQLQQYDTDEALAIQNRMRELQDEEYQRGLENEQYRAKLSDAIYGYLQEQKSGSGSSSGSNPPPKENPDEQNNPTNNQNLWQMLMNGLNNYKSTSAGTNANKNSKLQARTSTTLKTKSSTTAPAATVQTPTQPTYDNWKANTAKENQKNNKGKLLGRRTAL